METKPPAKSRMTSWVMTGAIALVALTTVFVLTRVATGIASGNPSAQPTATPKPQSVFQEGVDLQGAAASPFTLKDQTGATISLDQFRGHPVVLTFFDSLCPHPDCSLMAQYINWTAKDLGAQSADVAWVALSVNPWHDTPATATAFLTSRQVSIPLHYLLGTPDQMAPLWQAYHMQAILQSDGIVLHSTGVYVIDAQGRERVFLDEGFDPPVLSAYLHQLLTQQGASSQAAPGSSASSSTANAVRLSKTVKGYTIEFTAIPGQFGTYSFSVTVENAQGDTQGLPIQGAQVDAHLTMTNMVMEPLDVHLAPLNPPVPGTYQAAGVLSMVGSWQAVVSVQPPGAPAVQATFDFNAKY
jgi:protein SCO1